MKELTGLPARLNRDGAVVDVTLVYDAVASAQSYSMRRAVQRALS